MLNLKTLLDTEDQCLSILGGVLPKIWPCSQEGSLQGQKRRFPLSWKSKVWSDSYHTSKQVDCYLWVSQVLSEQRPKQLQLQWKQIDGDLQLKQLSGGWGCGVHHCLLRSRSSCKHSSRYLWSFRTVPSVLKLSGKKNSLDNVEVFRAMIKLSRQCLNLNHNMSSCRCLGWVGPMVWVRPLLLVWQEDQSTSLRQCSHSCCLWRRPNWDGSMLVRVLQSSRLPQYNQSRWLDQNNC